MPTKALIVVAKQPAAGQTKTRLCPPLDAATAAALYACFLRDTLALAGQLDAVDCAIGYTPAEAEGYFRELAPTAQLIVQRGAALGERLAHLLGDAFAGGAQQAVVLSSDIPTLPVGYLAQAFALLDEPYDLVIGPSDDGGYYLLGLKQPQPRLLREVTMSTEYVLRDTLVIAEQLGLRTALLPAWYDIDTIADLARLQRELAAAGPAIAPHTRRLLAQLSV